MTHFQNLYILHTILWSISDKKLNKGGKIIGGALRITRTILILFRFF